MNTLIVVILVFFIGWLFAGGNKSKKSSLIIDEKTEKSYKNAGRIFGFLCFSFLIFIVAGTEGWIDRGRFIFILVSLGVIWFVIEIFTGFIQYEKIKNKLIKWSDED